MISSRPVQEFGLKVRLTSCFTKSSTFSEIMSSLLDWKPKTFAALQVTRSDVRSHDDDRVLEVDRIAETVGELSVFKYLQEEC